MVHCWEEIRPTTSLPAHSGSPPAMTEVQEFVTEENTALILVCVSPFLYLFFLSFQPQVHPGLQLPGPLRLLHNPSAPGLLLPLSPHPGRKTSRKNSDCLIFMWSRSTFNPLREIALDTHRLVLFAIMCTKTENIWSNNLLRTAHLFKVQKLSDGRVSSLSIFLAVGSKVPVSSGKDSFKRFSIQKLVPNLVFSKCSGNIGTHSSHFG